MNAIICYDAIVAFFIDNQFNHWGKATILTNACSLCSSYKVM